MEENKMSYDELSELMSKISNAMETTRQKQTDIDNKTQELYEENRILMVEKGKQELEHMQADKKEFDEMTANSLITTMKQISSIKENEEKEYQDALMQTMQKNKQIEEKLNSIKAKSMAGDLSEEKLAWAEDSAKSAKEKLSEEMQAFQTEHFNKIAKLDEWENSITQYGIELNIEESLKQAILNKDSSEPNKQEQEELNETVDSKEQENDTAEKNEPEVEETEEDKDENSEPKKDSSKSVPPQSAKPQVQQVKNKTVKSGTPLKAQPAKSNSKNYAVKDVSFYIDTNNIPVYRAIVIDPDGVEHNEYLEVEEFINKIPKEKVGELKEKQITESKKFYDVNIDTLLQRVDEQYGTNSIKQYQDMMKAKYSIHKPADKLNIDYDFTNFYNASKEDRKTLKHIKKLAKENSNLELASYEAAPNILQRIWSKIKTLKLTDGKAQKEEKVDTNEPHDTTKNDIDKSFEDLANDPSFSIEQFQKVYNLSNEQMKEYEVKLKQIQSTPEYQKNRKGFIEEQKNKKEKEFRKKLVEEAKKGEGSNKDNVNPEEAKEPEEKSKEDNEQSL